MSLGLPSALRGLVPRSAGEVVHVSIVTAFLVEIVYCAVLVVVVLRPADHGPLLLGAAARVVPIELVVERRLYAIEGWIAAGALAIYVGVTGSRRVPTAP
jgi:hypothetical protein